MVELRNCSPKPNVRLFADSGWKYLGMELWTSPPREDEGEELDDTVWWLGATL